ncbi:MAG: threonine dehydratase, partial [Bacteroidetes bacterium]|nr:threonine dehydratase [Bacteroidota bacterium]
EYIQKHNKETGPALVGVELSSKEDYKALIKNLARYNITYTELNKDDTLFGYLV